MHSSAMMAVRAIILLVCLVAVPAFAIFGKNAPEVVRSLIQNYAAGSAKNNTSAAGPTDPPLFRPGLLAPGANHDMPAAAPFPSNAALEPVQPHVLAQRDPRPASNEASGAVAAISHQAEHSFRTAANGQTPAGPSVSDTAAGRFPPDYFRAAEQRLRQLGATYYLLEMFGPEGNQYRFFCKVAVDRKAEQLAFFATESDPLAAMNNVVRQVEGWRTHLQQ